MWSITKNKLTNNKGAALITAYFVITSLLTLITGFAISSVNELSLARRYRDSAAAFWLAEAGINQFLQDTTMLDSTGEQTVSFGNNYFHITKDDSDSMQRILTATGYVNGIERQIQVTFPGSPPDLFSNTLSVGGNMHFQGEGVWLPFIGWVKSTLDVFGKTRITGTYTEGGSAYESSFEDKQEGVSGNLTTLTYPDADGNGTADEFNDFVEHNRNVLASYPESEYVYIPVEEGQSVDIWPNKVFDGETLVGKKIVYVEGPSSGDGDVNIYFDATGWEDNQNLTIISTGTVNYVEPLEFNTENSNLNVITWEGYDETSLVIGKHNGTVYSHGGASYLEILDRSWTNGNIITNEGLTITEVVAFKEFHYVDPVRDGQVPPGFEGLIGGGGSGYSSTPDSWSEI